MSELHGAGCVYMSRTQVPPIRRDLKNRRVCLRYLWSCWYWCEGLWVGYAGRIYGIVGSLVRGRVCVCNIL